MESNLLASLIPEAGEHPHLPPRFFCVGLETVSWELYGFVGLGGGR